MNANRQFDKTRAIGGGKLIVIARVTPFRACSEKAAN
jgi:hypothetical protein